MNDKINENEHLRVILLYLIPIMGWILYTYQNTPLKLSWMVAAIGFCILFFCSALLISLFKKENVQFAPPDFAEPVLPQASHALSSEDISPELIEKIVNLEEVLKQKNIEFENKEEALMLALQENQELKIKLQETGESLSLQEEESRRKIVALELEAHQKQQASALLENQIYDLRYEIKTLLHLSEADYTIQGKEILRQETVADVVLEPIVSAPAPSTSRGLLTRCLDIAQKITAGYHASSLRKISLDPYAFDLRRLSEALRQETGALIIVYSPKEERVLFANSETKTFLGISPEQFAQDFSEYAGAEFSLWKSSVAHLLTRSEVGLSLNFANKSGDTVPLRAVIGSVPTGVFRTLVIGVFQPMP